MGIRFWRTVLFSKSPPLGRAGPNDHSFDVYLPTPKRGVWFRVPGLDAAHSGPLNAVARKHRGRHFLLHGMLNTYVIGVAVFLLLVAVTIIAALILRK